MKIQKENSGSVRGGAGRGSGWMGGQCGCERRIEVLVKIKKKWGGGSRGGGSGWGSGWM